MVIFVIQNMPNYSRFHVNCYLKATSNILFFIIFIDKIITNGFVFILNIMKLTIDNKNITKKWYSLYSSISYPCPIIKLQDLNETFDESSLKPIHSVKLLFSVQPGQILSGRHVNLKACYCCVIVFCLLPNNASWSRQSVLICPTGLTFAQ